MRYLGILLLLALFFSSCQGQTGKSRAEIPLFSPVKGSPISIVEDPSNVILGDLNKDGKLDLIIASSKSKTLFVLQGQGDGTFRKIGQREIILTEPPDETVLADLNGDFISDLAI